MKDRMIKRYAAEFIGTFFIVFAPVALSATARGPGGDGSLLSAAFVSGFAVLAMIYALGPISAAHFNPAVTLGFVVARKFPFKYAVPYWIAQFLGALFAAGIVAILFGPGAGTHVPASPGLVFRNLGTEISISFLLMLVIIAVATDRRVSSSVPALAIGLTVVVGVMIGGPITGGSMNPARSFGPAVFAGGPALSNYWLYLIAPAVGAVFAALAYEFIRIDVDHAVGAPNELLAALEDIDLPEQNESQ
jgi:MIP family channel proteins